MNNMALILPVLTVSFYVADHCGFCGLAQTLASHNIPWATSLRDTHPDVRGLGNYRPGVRYSGPRTCFLCGPCPPWKVHMGINWRPQLLWSSPSDAWTSSQHGNSILPAQGMHCWVCRKGHKDQLLHPRCALVSIRHGVYPLLLAFYSADENNNFSIWRQQLLVALWPLIAFLWIFPSSARTVTDTQHLKPNESKMKTNVFLLNLMYNPVWNYTFPS